MTSPRTLAARAAAALALALTGACTTPAAMVGTATVDQTYQFLSVNWTDGSRFVLAVQAREEAGRAVICGALADATESPSGSNLQISLAMQSRANLTHGGTIMVNTLRPFAGPYSARSPVGLTAHCVDTGRPWTPSLDLDAPFALSLPRTVRG